MSIIKTAIHRVCCHVKRASFVFGMPPKMTNYIIERPDRDTCLRLELYYRYPPNDKIFLTTGF
jgi:hypothetical protein